ncbi:MAG: diphthine synthase [Candidatus Micrarchaeia archaeon]
MLFLIGLGLYVDDLSVRALDALKSSKEIFVEQYTSFIPSGYVDELESKTGKSIRELARSDLEQDAEKTISMAKNENVSILIPGDPLIVTTHKLLLDIADRLGIPVLVLHAPSILSVAIGESRLSLYKFGQVVNVPFWKKDYTPTAFINVIKQNKERGLHSLLFLDIDHEHNRPMSLAECLEIMKKADTAENSGIFKADPFVIVIANAGMPDQRTIMSRSSKIERFSKELEGKMLSVIIPAELSFSEEGVRKFIDEL